MGQTLTYLAAHIIFSTKNRTPLLTDDLKTELIPYMAALIRELRGVAHEINGPPDHLHFLVSLPPMLPVSRAVGFTKANSARWINAKWPRRGRFSWQAGHGAFSVSPSRIADVCRYVREQEDHHRRISYQEEFILFLEKHGIP